MKIDRSKWFKHLKLYEEFKKEIPEELKTLYTKLRKEIGNPISSFQKVLNLNDYGFVDLTINLIVDFTLLDNILPYTERGIKYYSNINLNDLFEEKEIIDITITIVDSELRSERLCSVLAHELRHIYDIYTIQEESDMKSFTTDLQLQILRKGKISEEFNYFLHVMYLSLEHELIARNVMVYENFIHCHVSYEELKQLFVKSYLHDSFLELKNFDYQKVISSPQILIFTNLLIDKIGGKPCQNRSDIETFYQHWTLYFKTKAEEYLLEADKILREINMIKENQQYKGKKVAEILRDIYQKYIK